MILVDFAGFYSCPGFYFL